MKRSRTSWLIWVGAAVKLVLANGFAVGQTRMVDITVDDIRPLAAAVLKVEELSGIPINYEDVPVYYPGDLEDVTDIVVRTPLPAGERIIAPHKRHFSVPIAADAATGKLNGAQAVREALLRLIAAYSAENLPGGFELETSNGVFFVKPVRYRDATGATRSMTPVLSNRITLPQQTRDRPQTWRLILGQVSSAAGVRVEDATAMSELLGPATLGAENEPANQVVARFLASRSGPTPLALDATWDEGLAYRLLFDATLKKYFLNVHLLANSRARKVPVPYKYSPPPRHRGPVDGGSSGARVR